MRVRFPPSRPSRCGSIWLEHRVRDAGTAGSNPATSTISPKNIFAGRASWRRRLAYTQVSHGFDSLAPYHPERMYSSPRREDHKIWSICGVL